MENSERTRCIGIGTMHNCTLHKAHPWWRTISAQRKIILEHALAKIREHRTGLRRKWKETKKGKKTAALAATAATAEK